MVLDASGNGMGGTEIEPVLDLHRLETLNLADNDLEEMAQVRPCLLQRKVQQQKESFYVEFGR